MKYVFLHLEKTAGTSLVSYFKGNIQSGKFQYIHLTELEGLNKDNKLLKLDFVAGHLNYNQILKYFNNYQVITYLRDPIKRIVSFYNFAKNGPRTKDPITIKSKELNIEEFIDYCIDVNDRRFINGMVHKLSSENNPKNELSSAIANLHNIFFVGIQEYFDDSLILMSEKLNMKKPEIFPKENITKKTNDDVILNENTIKKLISINNLDIQLYAEASKIYNIQKKESQRLTFGHKPTKVLNFP